MSDVVVRKCSGAEAKRNPNFPSLVREYADECAFHELPPPDEKLAAYDALDASDIFTLYGAFIGDMLIGFCAVLTPVIPHYGVGVTCTESLFVGKAYRNKGGAGLKLLSAAECHAMEAKSPGLLVSAPVDGALAKLLERYHPYRETNRVFFRRTP